jgi:hypothetical protein
MFKRMSVVFGAGLLLMVASCGKHSTAPSSNPAGPVSKYAPFWGLWQAAYQSNPESGKFKLLLNRDTTFSFSQVVDSSGAVSNQESGDYTIDTGGKLIRLVTASYEAEYHYTGDTLRMLVTWTSGHDFMHSLNPATATWEFFKQ